MNRQKMFRIFGWFVALLMLSGIIFSLALRFEGSIAASESSPVSLQSTSMPTVTPQFPEKAVLDYVAKREGVPVEQLEVVYVEQTRYEMLGRDFWLVKVNDLSS